MAHHGNSRDDANLYESYHFADVEASPPPSEIQLGSKSKMEDECVVKYLIDTHTAGPPSIPARSTGVFLCFRLWLPEILASILSLLSLISILVLVSHYHGRGVQELAVYHALSLNGLIALLSTVTRAALMVPIGSILSQEALLWLSTSRGAELEDLEISDAASRGASGSLVLLFKVQKRWLALFAAVVTIVSLAFGSFTQQLLAFKSFPVIAAIKTPGNIPHAERWNMSVGDARDGFNSTVDVPFKMKAATYIGASNTDSEPLTASCPTGNCTWPITPSLGICGACSKSSYQTSCQSNQSTCKYTLASGNVAEVGVLHRQGDLGSGAGFHVMTNLKAVYNRSDVDRLYIANFDVFRGPPGLGFEDILSPTDPNMISLNCSLWMCVQAYKTTMTDSNQSQSTASDYHVVDKTTFPTFGLEWVSKDYKTYSDDPDSSPDSRYSDHDSADDYDDSYDPEGILNFTFRDLPSNMNPIPGTNYTITAAAAFALIKHLRPLLNGTLARSHVYGASDWLWPMHDASENLDKWIKKLAHSMTNVIRAQSSNQIEAYNGEAFQLGIQVRWEWIILPAVLVVSSLALLIVTILETAKGPIGPWKGSPLLYLFTDMDRDIKKRATGRMHNYNDLQKAVGKMRVNLYVDDEGECKLSAA